MSEQEPNKEPNKEPMALGPIHPKKPAGAGHAKAPRRTQRKFRSLDDVASGIEQLFRMWSNGMIESSELKIAVATLNTIAGLLPKSGESQGISISERLCARLAADPELLNELSEILPVDFTTAVIRDQGPNDHAA